MADLYEALILAVPEITQDETKHIENELDRVVNKTKGKIISFERWGKYKLFYTIRKNDYGVYFLVRFEAPDHALLKDIQELFRVKLHDVVMRHMITCVEPGAVEYQRPKSLEETPTSRDMDTFLKENEMEELLSSVDSDKSKSRDGDKTVEKVKSEDIVEQKA